MARNLRVAWQHHEQDQTSVYSDVDQVGEGASASSAKETVTAPPVVARFYRAEEEAICEARYLLEEAHGANNTTGSSLGLRDPTAGQAECLRRVVVTASGNLAVQFDLRVVPVTDEAAMDVLGFDWLVVRQCESLVQEVSGQGTYSLSRDQFEQMRLNAGEADDDGLGAGGRLEGEPVCFHHWVSGYAHVPDCSPGDGQ
mmetsp:Transcript_5656/g.13030  ORF Transcript_5656/g.13030 Transcript_5656/m.13030 type:complete len:199 (-) Transcript_5656:72-668(-)